MPLPHDGLIKLAEECGELIQVAMKRVTSQENSHWDGSDLRVRLEEEIADVTAAMDVVINSFELNVDHINDRADLKRRLFEYWQEGGTENALPKK